LYFKLWFTGYLILFGILIWFLYKTITSYEDNSYWKRAKYVGIFTFVYIVLNLLITIWIV